MLRNKIIVVLSFVIIIGIAVFLYFANTITYNPDNASGNTAGNLYNGGFFCELNGIVYFANPDDGDKLYKMKPDGSELEKINDDKVSFINGYDKYLYYKRSDSVSTFKIFKLNTNGLYRINISGRNVKEIHGGYVDMVTLAGNFLYYQRTNDNGKFEIAKTKIDKEEDKVVVEESYKIFCSYEGKLYYTEVKENHNLYVHDTLTDEKTLLIEGNIYLPDTDGRYVYYIDMNNNRALTRYDINTSETFLITNDQCINYNLSKNKDIIFYQAENSDGHFLGRVDTFGENRIILAQGDYSNISITSEYTYFYMILGTEKVLYRTKTYGNGSIEPYNFEVIK